MAAEVGASAAAQQQIALPPEGADITNIQDEDLLRRMWQATEDFGRKKEIRARMYKLREQRLKEFYTTGEVLSDLMSTTLDSSTSATESSANNGGVSSTIVTTRRTTYAASESGDSVGGGGLVVTTTETIRGGGGSQESLIIRYRSGGNEDENLKNIEMDRRQLQGSSELIYESGGKTTRSTRSAMSSSNQSSAMITKSSSYGLHSQSLADQGFLTMKSKEIRDSESPTRDFSHLHNRQITSSTTHGGPGGGGYWYEESRSYHTGDDGAEVVQYGTRGGQQGYSSSSVIEYGDGGTTVYRTGETAVKSEHQEQKSSSTKMEVSSSQQEHSASSSYSFSSSNRSTEDWVQKHQEDDCFGRDQSQPLQIESVRSGAYEESTVKERDGKTSVHVEKTSKTERVSDVAESETKISKEEVESRRTTTEKFEEVESKDEPRGPKQKVTQRSKTGELPLEVNITKQVTTEITTSVPSTATSTPLPDSGPTPDVGSWTVVSGKQNGVCSSTDEFVFRSGTTTETSNIRDTTQRITTTDSTNDSTVISDTQKVITETVKPSYSVPAAGKPTPVDSPVTSPSVEVKSIMKQTTTTTTTSSTPQAPTQSNYYIQTKRISTEVSPTHDAFARSLRASPEKTQTYTTRASSKSSIDTNTTILSSPTRPQRTSVTSPTGRGSSPDKGSNRPRDRSSPMKQQTPSPSASKEKRKLSSSLAKGIGGKRTATPGASPSASPVRGRSPCSDDDEPRRRVGTSPEKKKSTVTREGSPFSEPSRKSPAKETKPALRKTPEKSPARDTPDSHQESPKRKPSETTIVTKETKTTTSIGRRPSKGPKDERPAGRKPSTDRLTSPVSSPMKDKAPELPKEKKPGDDKSPTSPQRPKDLDLKARPTTGTKVTPSSPMDKTPTKPKDQDKPKDDKRRPSKDSTEPQKIHPEDKESPKTHRILKADQPEEEFEVVCEAPETFDVKIITPIVHSVEYPTDEPEKRTRKTTVEEEAVTKKIAHELEIERLKKPTIPGVVPKEDDTPQKPLENVPVTSGMRPEDDSEYPREPKDSYEETPIAPESDSPGFRTTRRDSLPRVSPSREGTIPSDLQRKQSPSPVREAPKSPRRSPIRDSPVGDTQCRQPPSPSRDSPLRETKRPTSPMSSPSRKSPARDSPRASSSSPAREIQRKQSPSPARDIPSYASPLRRSPVRESPKKKSPSPAKELPKSSSPSRQSPARESPARDSPRKPSPARPDDSPKTYSPTRKPSTRDSPVRESSRKHSPSPAKESPEKGHPRRHSPSPAKESSTRKSPARESPLRESPRKHSPSPARETPAKRPVGKSPERDGLRKSPARDTPTKPTKERDSPFRRRPEEKPSPDKSPARKPSIKDSPRKESPARKTPERDTTGKSPVRQSPARDMRNKTPERESPKKTPTRPSPAKEAPKRDSSPKKPCDHDLPKKPSLTRKASDKAIPKKDTIARRSQSTEIPAAKRASPFKDSPKTDDIPQRKAPAAQSPVRKSPPKETSVRKIPQYSSPSRPTPDSTGDSPNADKPWRQTPVRAAPKEIPDTPTKTPVKEFPPSGIPRTMSPVRRPLGTDSVPSSPESPRQKEGRPQPSTSSPEKSPPSQRPSRSPERAPTKKQPESTKPVSRIPGRAPASNITPPSQKRPAPSSSIPSYTAPLRRTPKDECCPHHHGDSPKTEPKGTVSRPQPGSKIPESSVRRPGESSVDRKSTKITTSTVRKTKKPKKQRPVSGTESEEEVSSTETEEDEKECVEERVTVREKEVRSISEVFVQDMSKAPYPMQNGGQPDRPVSLSLITTATKTVTSGEEVQQLIDSEGNVTTTTYQQPSTITMSVSCKNTDYDGKEVTHTVRKTTYPDRPDEDEDVEILEIDDDEDIKPRQAIEYPFDEESPKVPKQAPTQTSPKRFGSPAKPIKKETKPQTGPGRRPTTESPVRRQPNEIEPGKKRIPTTTTPSSPKQPTTAKTPSSAPKRPTQPIAEPQDENTSPKSLRKPGQISRLPAKQAPKQETKKITSVTGKTTVQKGKTTVTTMVSSTARQKSSYVSSTVEKTQPRQPLRGAPQPKQLKPAPKGKIPQKTGKGIPVKDTKKRVTNGHVPHPIEPEEDETEEEIDEKETPLVDDVEKTDKYYDEEDVLDEEKVTDTISVTPVGSKPVDDKPQGLHPSTAFTTVTGIQTMTEIRQVSRESTPDAPGRRPRYADRVSEPDDDDVYYEEKGVTKITRRDQEIVDKKTVDQMERTLTVTMPRLETVEQRYEEEEELREFERTEMEQRRLVRTEQVTDLDEDEPKPEDEDDIEPANLSVASKVSRFLTASATAAAPPQPSQAPKMEPKRGARRPSWEPEDSPRQPKEDEVDQRSYKTEELSSFAVKRARDIFETIAKTPATSEPTPTTPKLKTDVLGKASLFETKQVDEINRIRTTQTLRKSFTGSDESLGEEGLPKEKPCTDYTESEEDYDDEPVEQIKESPTKKPLPKDTAPYKPQFERDLPRESSPGRTFKTQPEKEASPSRTFKPHTEREVPKEPIRKTSKPLAEKPSEPKEKPSYRDETYDEPSDEELPEGDKPKKTTPYDSSPKPQEPSTPKSTDTDATRRKNIFRDATTPKEDEQVPKVKKTSIGSGMGREAFLKRMSKFASTEETKTVSTVKESPKMKPVSKFQPKPEGDAPARRPSKDSESPSRRVSTDSPTRRISRDEPEYRRSPARDVSKPSTDTYTRRPSRDQPRSDAESPRRTPTRETPSQPSESTRRTDTYTRKTSKEICRTEVESTRRTPTRETPTQPSEAPKRPSTDTFTRKPKDRPTGDAESPRRTPTRETPTQPRKEERRPSADTTRRLSREFPREDATPKDERPKGATFTRRPSKDRVREDEVPKRPQDGTFTRKPKVTENDSPRPEDSYPRGSDTFTRRPSKDRQSPKRDSPMRAPEEDSPRNTGTYTRKASTERFKESSLSPRSSPARDIHPKRPEESPRRPSQDRTTERRGSDTFTRRRSQPRDEEPKKPESAADALKPYLRTRTQEFQDDNKKLKPDDKTPKKLSSSRFETFTKRDSSTSVTKDDTKRLFPVNADRTPKKLSGSRFETFTKRDSATSVKATESVVTKTKTTTSTTRKSVEREVETREEYDESPRYAREESPAKTERKTPERTPEKIEKRPAERVERTPDRRTPDRRTPDRKTPERREDSPASFGEPLRKKPSKEVEDEPVRKAPRPDDEEIEPRISNRRRPSKEGSPRPEVKPDDEIPDQQRRRSSGGKFGVVLRQSSSVGSRVEALLSKVEKRASTTTTATVTLAPTKRRPSKGPDSSLEIEEIFDLEFLEQMLEKATDYEQRRRIRAQIRIVRRGEGRPEGAKEAPKEREPTRPSTLVSKTKTPTPSAPPADEPDAEEDKKCKPRRPSHPRESPEKVTTVPSLTRKPSRAEEVGGELTSPSVVAKLLPSSTTGTPSSRPSPAPSSTPKKNSLTSSSGLPREACPTDSITSSYGVGPTDESGRPLFGLRALRRPQQQPPDSLPSAPAPSPITQSREASLEPRPQSPETSDVRDSSGRPLFGLRAITISSTSKTTKEGRRVIERSKSPETGERPGSESPSEDEEDSVQRKDMPSTSTASTTETSVHLRDLVRRHEQHARGNVPSQPVAPVQKPRAKLRDSFILPQHSLDDEEEDVVEEGRSKPVETSPASKTFPSALPSSVAESGKIVAERSSTLKSIIQKHEKNTDSEYTNDKLNRRDSGLGAYTEEEELVPAKNNYCRRAQDYSTDEDEEDDYDDEEYQDIENGQRQETTTVKVTSDVVRRPGILKKPKDEVTESTTATSTSSTTRSQQSVSEKSGYVSLKKDVIQSVDDSEGAVDDEDDEEVVSTGKGRTPKGSTGRRPSNDQDEGPSSRATYSSYTTSSSSSSVARSGGEVERRRSSTSTPYRVDEDDGDSNDGIEVIRSPSENRFSSTTTTVTRRVVSGSESPKVVTTTTTTKRSTGKPDEEQTEVLVQDSRSSSARKKFEPPSAAPTSPSPSAAFPRITRGGSVRALQQKFQQAAAEAASGGPDSPSRTYPKAGLIFRTASFRQTSLSSPPNSPQTPVHSPSAPCIPSTANVNGHAGTKTTVGEVVERRTVTSSSARGVTSVQKDDSDSDYSQQIRRRSVENDRGSSPTSRRSAEITTVSRTRQPIVDDYDDEDVHGTGESVTVEQRTVVVTNGSTGSQSRSFLGNQTKVTGVQDVLSRMREADNEGPAEGDTVEDSEARALLNKFLGAQVILQGMEPLINAQSPSLVRQVEKQRVQKKQESATVVYSPDIDLDGIWDERRLRQLLESCSDYDGRRKIRARIRTVMAEQKVTAEIVAEGRLEAEREESARSKAIVSKQSDDGQMETSTTVLRSVQGELLPLIVDQLKTSLERGEGSGGGPLSGFRISSSSSEEGPFDSGTESGDDRRNQRRRRIQQQQQKREETTGGEEGDAEDEEEEDEDIQMPHGEFSSFMEGLKTSIEEAAARRRRERAPGDGEDYEGTQRENRMEKQFVNNDKKGVTDAGEELLTEVHTALDKLHGTLQTSTGLDPEKSQALICLISRLQSSLEEEQKTRKEKQPEIIPPPAAPPPRTVVPDWKARCQRKRQGRAHTVGVSQEELEDARRLLQSQEKEKEEEEKGQMGEKEEGNHITSSISPAAVGECKSYSLMKQSSAGDLAPPSWATNSVAARVFRPVRFEPRNSPSWASMFNKTAKPFQREALGKNPPQAPKYPICPPPLPPPPAQPQLAPPSTTSRSPNVQKAPEPFGGAATPEATQKPPEIPPKPSFDTPSAVSYLSQNHYVPPPATAPAVPPSPNGPPIWQPPYSPNPPTLSSSGTSSGTTGLSHRDSESSISGSVSTKPETEDEEDERPVKEVRVNGDGVTGEEDEEDDDENESEEVTQVTQREVKPYTNGVSTYGVRNIEPLLATASEFRPSEKRSVHHSLSLDSGTKRAQEDTLTTPGDVGKRASPLARSWTLDDPSALLFTQAESVQIAVHKAAIKKQLTQEEEQRMRLPLRPQNGLGEKFTRSQSTTEEDSTPISNGGVEHGPVVAREAGGSGSDSYGECGSGVRINGDGYVQRTTSGSSVSSVASSRNSATVPNGIYVLNNGNENQNPPVPPRRESIPAANSYENNAGGNIREYENANGGWNQSKSQGTSGSEGSGQKSYQNGSADRRELPKEEFTERYRESADDELAQLHSQMANQSRQQSKVEKKKRMKRANTIDIPKPLNFYVDEDDYSSGEEMDEDGEMKEDGSSGMSNHRAAYLALRGPIRVKIPQSKPLAPSFQAKTENDRKFLAFLEQHSGNTPNRAEVQPSYHSSARGGAHWSNRFSNIKTAFEGSGRGSEHNVGYGRGRGMGRNSLGEIGGPVSARNFWRAADDSVTRSRGSSHGPRLSREGSTLLRRLFEERDAAAAENNVSGKADPRSAENVAKLPWTTETQTKGDDSVVIGSLTVASKKQLFSAMKAAPPPPEVKGPVPMGKFSHAPLSAFRPIQSKEQSIVPTQGPMPLSSPGAVRIASQKFGASPAAVPAKPQVSHVPLGSKSPHNTRVAFVPAQGSHSPVGGPPPWAKDDAHDRVHSTSALFETRARDPSPPPPPMSFTSHTVAHSQVYNPVQLGQPVGGVPQSPRSIVQPHYMDHSQGAVLPTKAPQNTVPTPPPRSKAPRAPMVHTTPQSHSPPPPALPPPPPIYARPSPPTVPMPLQVQPPTPPKPVYRQPSPPLQSPTVVYSEATPPPVVLPYPRTNIEPPSPEPELQCAAVTKVMTGPVFQQAVVQKRRRGGEDEEEEEEGRESAARNLSSALHRLSVSPSLPRRTTPPCPPKPVDYYPKEQSSDSGRVFSAETYLHPSHAAYIGEDQAVHKHESTSYSPLPPQEVVSPQNTDKKTEERSIPEKLSLKEQEEFYQKQLQAVREAQEARRRYEEAQRESYKRTSKSCTHEGPVPPPPPNRYQRASLTTDTREENNESVVTMRLQIPVKEPELYSSHVTAHSLSPVQRGMGAIRSNSHHDVRHALASVSPIQQRVESPRRDTEDRSPTSVLQKSESWHMLGQLGQSVQGSKRPQSIALDQAKRRAPPSLPKMSFPKQFEARLSPETVESKQKKVEAYLKGQALGLKSGSGANSPSKQKTPVSEPMTPLLLDDNLENVDEAFESLFNAATKAQDKRVVAERGQGSSKDQWSSHKGLQKSQSQHLLRPPAPPRESSASPQFQRKQKAWEESCMVKTKLAQNISGSHSEATSMSSSTESSVTKTEVHTKTSNYSATVTGKSRVSKAPPSKTMSPFAKFKQLDEQNAGSSPNSPKSPGGTGPLFKFTDPQLSRSASGVKDKLLYWCQVKTKEYKNIQIENFSTSWSNGLAFCALIHHFCPDAFDYDTLRPEERRKNFDLAFRVADEKAGIAPLLDVEDMVTMRKPDWKCVFTYVQSIYRRFKDED